MKIQPISIFQQRFQRSSPQDNSQRLLYLSLPAQQAEGPTLRRWEEESRLQQIDLGGMEYINTRPLTYMVHRIQHSSRVATVFNEVNESCHLGLKFECPETVLTMAKRINQREVQEKKYKPSADKKMYRWVFGEFKIFIWAVVYKCLINGLQIQELSLEVIKEIQNIFKSKSLCFIQYEVQLLINQKYDLVSENWQEEEVALFSQIMARAGKGKINWRAVSFELYQTSGGRYFRNIHHCRQKWFNHMNPIVKKGDWTIEEDILIFNLIKEHGLRWSMISRAMGKIRTEHMVKNRFNRYYRQWKLTKDATIETIYKCFVDRIYKPYFRRHKKIESLLEKRLLNVQFDDEGSVEQSQEGQNRMEVHNLDHEGEKIDGRQEGMELEGRAIQVGSQREESEQNQDEEKRMKANLLAIKAFYSAENIRAENQAKIILHQMHHVHSIDKSHDRPRQKLQDGTHEKLEEKPSKSEEPIFSSKAASKELEVKIEADPVITLIHSIPAKQQASAVPPEKQGRQAQQNDWNFFPFFNMYCPPPPGYVFPFLF